LGTLTITRYGTGLELATALVGDTVVDLRREPGEEQWGAYVQLSKIKNIPTARGFSHTKVKQGPRGPSFVVTAETAEDALERMTIILHNQL
jgi:hypothetical protein